MNTDCVKEFEQYRPLMLSIAYRMLGSVTEAEDIVQDAYLRYQATALEEIVSHKAFLSTIVTRLSINRLQSAQTKRETYVGPWLPEPVLTGRDEPFIRAEEQLELQESLSLAFLALLEQLTPLERAVFLLREVFDYAYNEIAQITGREEAACRQLFSRAKKHIASHRPRFRPSPETHRRILVEFIQATENGDLVGLLQLLSDDVVLWADGGGKAVGALHRPLRGRTAVARFMLATPRLATEPFHGDVLEVNGAPALVLRASGEARIVLSIDIDQVHISAIHVVGNPDKLRGVNQALDGTKEEHS